jgi:hypothetical protein
MKSSTLKLLLPALLAISGCIPQYNTYRSHINHMVQIPGAIKVECRNDKSIVEKVKVTLKMVRVSNWIINDHDYSLDIEAQYESLPDDQAEEIQRQLNEAYGVMRVELTREVIPHANSIERWPG